MSKISKLPPFYFFSSIFLNVIFYFVVPNSNIIIFPYNIIGVIIIICGFYIMHTSSKIFDKKQTTFLLEEPSAFVTEGFYKISRNPMYLSALMLIFGQSILMGNIVSFVTSAFFYLCINYFCIPYEEILMENKFGDQYIDYK